MNKANSFKQFGQALKEAERLKQKTFNHFQNHQYMILEVGKNYIVENFSWSARDEAIKNNNLLLIV